MRTARVTRLMEIGLPHAALRCAPHDAQESFTSGWQHGSRPIIGVTCHASVGVAHGEEPTIPRPPQQIFAGDLSGSGFDPRLGAAVHAADAAACRRCLLARASGARRSPGAGAGRAQRRARGMELALGNRCGRRSADEFPQPAGSLSGAGARAGARVLLHLRPAGLPPRLARGSVGCGFQQERRLAHRLRDGVAVLERSERLCPSPQAAAATPVRRNRAAPLENRRDRPQSAAVPGLARAAGSAMAGTAGLLGRAEPAGDQSRGSRRQMRGREHSTVERKMPCRPARARSNFRESDPEIGACADRAGWRKIPSAAHARPERRRR